MDLDRARHRDEVRREGEQRVVQFGEQRLGVFGEVPVGEAIELDVDPFAEERQAAAGLLLAGRRVARLGAVRGDNHAHFPAVAKVLGHEAAAADRLVVRMRREHEQPLAAQSRRLVGNRLRLDGHRRRIIGCALRRRPDWRIIGVGFV